MTKYNPVSTYRLQFNSTFKLKDAEAILPYLHKSGIKTIYASPVAEAVKGSTHGYDVTNPLRLNSEIGTEEEFEQLIEKVHEYKMGWIQDIVPNHMAFSIENPWIYDVLEKGKESEFYDFFDILEHHPDDNLKNRLMLPFFGKPPEDMIRDMELSVVWGKTGFRLKYFDSEYPLSVPAYSELLKSVSLSDVPQVVKVFLQAEDINQNFDEHKRNLISSGSSSADTGAYINKCVEAVNSSPEKMKALVDKLYYYPSFWRDTERKINYRRFFTINGLICLNIQKEKVFKNCHRLVDKWIKNKMIDGVRIDHIDGLYNPAEYLKRLRNLIGDEAVIYVEKILEKDEFLPERWPVEGSTGYEFLGMVNNLITNAEKGPIFYSYYNQWVDKPDDFDKVFYKKSRFILYNRLNGELDNLTRECLTLQSVINKIPDGKIIKEAIGEFLVFCPVYKVYKSPSKFSEHERSMIKEISTEAIKKNGENKKALMMLHDLFLLKLPGARNELPQVDQFFRHCMQFTGPLMAKGIEDTAFYSYNPFIGHNEVGDSPGYFGISTETFHSLMEVQQNNRPLTMNVISTHDTKRGEDARARLNVLSDIPVKWMDATKEWREMNRQFKQVKAGRKIPSANDEYLIYQVLCAHLPMNAKIDEAFVERLHEYLVKAMREAKVNSSWSNPDEDYESATLKFTSDILSPETAFPEHFLLFMEEVIPHGIINSITQLILKNTLPGVPDTFQGTETWNLSFVDPDNRREVAYKKLSADLDTIIADYSSDATALAGKLFDESLNGKLKQWIGQITLQERIRYPDLFLKGNYTPVKVIGKYRKNAMAFSRMYHDQYLLVVVPLNTASMSGDFIWEETYLKFPEFQPMKMENIFTGKQTEIKGTQDLDEIFETLPFAMLRNTPR